MASELLSSDHLEERSDAERSARAGRGLAAGVHLGRYELLVPIASGRMATVWAARLTGHRGFSKLVAVKTILPQLARELVFEQMFLEEARIASRIHHPNVCEIYEFGEEQRSLYLAMEWVSGDTLARLLEASQPSQPPLPPRVAARIVADACAGLAAAHERGIVHRDISAHNVLVGENGVVKLADFGVAKACSGTDETTSGFLKGKLAYAAPEYIETGRVDARTDIFSMGVVLYEATVGELPFTGDRDAAVMAAILRGEPRRPRDVNASYPRELETIVLRAIARDPNARYETAEELRCVLEQWLARSGAPVMQSAVTKLVMSRIGMRIEDRRAEVRETMRMLDEAPPPASAVGRRAAVAHHANANASAPVVVPAAPITQPLGLSEAYAPPGAYVQGQGHGHGQAYSSYPPAPLAYDASASESRRPPALGSIPPAGVTASANKTPMVLVAVAFAMCAALGVMGRQVIKKAAPMDTAPAAAAEMVAPNANASASANANANANASANANANASANANANANEDAGAAVEEIELPDEPVAPAASGSAMPAQPALPPNPY